MSMTLSHAINRLKARGLRLTKTRKDLIGFILSQIGHWTIENLAKKSHQKFPKIGIATVYRTVNLMVEEKLISKTQVGASAARYEVMPSHHHDHLTCLTCGGIFEFENEAIERLQSQIAKKLCFQIVDHCMELYGECQRKKCKYRPQAD